MVTSTKLPALNGGKIKIRSFAILLLCSLVLMNSCKTDEAAAPAASSFTVDSNSGILSVTKFNFTVNEVKANSVTLYPYGLAHANMGTVAVTFSGGAAIIKDFKYGYAGVFDAVVVTNNNTTDPDGKISTKNTVSAPTKITITSRSSKFSKFLVQHSISRSNPLDTTNKIVRDTIPFAPGLTPKKDLTASFTADPFAVVTVGTTTQHSDTTKNDFTSPLIYTVTSQDKTKSTPYTVNVYMTPVEKNTDIKSLSGAVTSTNALGGADKKTPTTAGGSVDNTLKKAVVYLPYGSPANMYDSIEVSYATAGSFSVLKYGAEKPKMKQGRSIDLTATKTLVVVPQDSTTSIPPAGTTPNASYTLYATTAPKLELSFSDLIPKVSGTTSGFNIAFSVIKGTSLTNLVTATKETLPAGVTINSYTTLSTADGSTPQPFIPSVTPGVGITPVDYTKPVKFMLNVTDTNIGVTYTVVYTVTVTEVQ